MPRLKKPQTLNEPLKIINDAHPVDIIPGEGFPWKKVLPIVHRVSQTFGYQRIETSPIESLDIFHQHKELFGIDEPRHVMLETPLSKKFALRPQNFLSVLRAYMTHQVYARERITKWYYVSPAFLHEKDALAHLYEFGLVNFGEPTSISDAQMMMVIKVLLEDFGVGNAVFEINHKGCENCSAYYQELLSGYFQQNKFDLCGTCQQRLSKESSKVNELDLESMGELFDCRQEQCQPVLSNAPQIIDFLDASCNHQLTSLLESLDELEIPYQLNPRLFGNRRLSHALFRVKLLGSGVNGEQELFLGVGGRHNRFVSKITGQDLAALVFSIPLNALHQMTESFGIEPKEEHLADVFLINLGELAAKKSLRLFWDLQRNHITVAEHFGENGIKNQFKLAEKKGCALSLVIGQKEALDDTVILRDVRSGIQEVFSQERIIEEVKKRLQD